MKKGLERGEKYRGRFDLDDAEFLRIAFDLRDEGDGIAELLLGREISRCKWRTLEILEQTLLRLLHQRRIANEKRESERKETCIHKSINPCQRHTKIKHAKCPEAL